MVFARPRAHVALVLAVVGHILHDRAALAEACGSGAGSSCSGAGGAGGGGLEEQGDGGDGGVLLQLSNLSRPLKVKVGESLLGGLRMWFGYAREGLRCFERGDLENLVGERGGDVEQHLRLADVVVLLQLEHMPSARQMEEDGDLIDFQVESCESQGGVSLDTQMVVLAGNKTLVQISVIAENNPKQPDQGLLSVWYNPQVVMPGKGLAYKNIFPDNATDCFDEGTDKSGKLEVIADNPLSLCPKANEEGWVHYASAQGTLAMSFVPVGGGGEPFAVLGLSMPVSDFEGKEAMLKRAMVDIRFKLGVPHDRIFRVGLQATQEKDQHFVGLGRGGSSTFSVGSSLAPKVQLQLQSDRRSAVLGGSSSSVTAVHFDPGRRTASAQSQGLRRR